MGAMTGTKEFAVTTTLATMAISRTVESKEISVVVVLSASGKTTITGKKTRMKLNQKKKTKTIATTGTMDSIKNTVIITDRKIKEDRLRAYRN